MTFSWSQSAYAAHESGTRRASDEQRKIYLAAFIPLIAARRTHSTVPSEQEQRRRQASRLRLARQMAAFETAKDAAKFYGWKLQTYYAHESGRRGMSVEHARMYGLAFSVAANWILMGKAPSGLADRRQRPEGFEEAVAKAIDSYDDRLAFPLLQFASSTRRAQPEHISASSAAHQNISSHQIPIETFNVSGDIVEIIRERAVDKSAGSAAKLAWGFPGGFLEHVWDIKSRNLLVVPVSLGNPNEGLSAGDRIVVDGDDKTGEKNAAFAYEDLEHGVRVLRAQPKKSEPLQMIGRVLVKLARAP